MEAAAANAWYEVSVVRQCVKKYRNFSDEEETAPLVSEWDLE